MATKWLLLLVALIYGCHAQPLPPNFIVLVTVSPAACCMLARRPLTFGQQRREL